jgi:uncharacterized protein YcaQ
VLADVWVGLLSASILNPRLSSPPLSISVETARRFMQRATGLQGGFADVDAALKHLGFVQIDPINVCGRMHDHILRTRVQGYREHDLMTHLHQDGVRSAFEHHLPDSHNLAAMPVEAWPHLQRAMQARAKADSSWSGKLTAEEKRLAIKLLARMRDQGPLCSQDIQSDRKAKSHAWDSTTLAKSTLQKLFFHGRVLIAKREGNRRFYDLPERVLPATILNAKMPSEAETAHWLARLKLRQRRLAILKSSEKSILGSDVQAVTISGLPKLRLHLLTEDLPQLEKAESISGPLLIAPLDPIIYDRRVTEQLWSFDYRWEVYVPPQKRVRGYYALPLLSGDIFKGHADVKADREAGKLLVISHEGRGAKATAKDLARFLGLRAGSV